MKRLFDDFQKAAGLIGKPVCFQETNRCVQILARGITGGVVINVELSQRIKQGQTTVIYTIEFGPPARKQRSIFLADDLKPCDGRSPTDRAP